MPHTITALPHIELFYFSMKTEMWTEVKIPVPAPDYKPEPGYWMKERPVSWEHVEYIVNKYAFTPSPANGHISPKDISRLSVIKHLNTYTAEWFGRVMCDYGIAYQS